MRTQVRKKANLTIHRQIYILDIFYTVGNNIKVTENKKMQIVSYTEAQTQREQEKTQFCKEPSHKLYMAGYFLSYCNNLVDTSQGTAAMSWFTGW